MLTLCKDEGWAASVLCSFSNSGTAREGVFFSLAYPPSEVPCCADNRAGPQRWDDARKNIKMPVLYICT